MKSELANPLGSVAVVIPAYKVSNQILDVIQAIPKQIRHIIVVDDACPEGSGDLVASTAQKSRVSVLRHETNQGVGGAVITGYKAALAKPDVQIIVKLDGDGQMLPSNIEKLIKPILEDRADYTKGNRFDSIEDLEQMPRLRIFGNGVLSFLSKISSGYWNITDPTNGFTAISREMLERVKLEKVRKSFFFENDMLFRLSLVRAVVIDVPMKSRYSDEKSNLKISKIIGEFPIRYLINYGKRVLYQYYLREWSLASFELPLGLILFFSGITSGFAFWVSNSQIGSFASSGQVMLASLPIIVGSQLLLAFTNYDINSTPRR